MYLAQKPKQVDSRVLSPGKTALVWKWSNEAAVSSSDQRHLVNDPCSHAMVISKYSQQDEGVSVALPVER